MPAKQEAGIVQKVREFGNSINPYVGQVLGAIARLGLPDLLGAPQDPKRSRESFLVPTAIEISALLLGIEHSSQLGIHPLLGGAFAYALGRAMNLLAQSFNNVDLSEGGQKDS